ERARDTPDLLDGALPFEALQASAHFDRVLYDGDEFSATAAEEEFLGLPVLLDPDQVAVLRKRQAEQFRPSARPGAAVGAVLGGAGLGGAGLGGAGRTQATRENLAALRKELNGLVGAWHHRTGQPHAVVHADLRRACGGPPLPQATAEQIRARITTMRRWATSGR
ncbi:MAG TPA: ATP-dependent helicase, partial [Streptosporangiaceae bacterium]|nr:ATP-dependent helicase [Streptosporangiaceae bacterium]